MQDYRIYILDRIGLNLGPAKIVQCADDQAAIEHARQLHSNERIIEVWHLDRMVICLEPNTD